MGASLLQPVAYEGERALRRGIGQHMVRVIVRSLKTSGRKNYGLVQKGEVVAWAGAVLAEEDRDGGSAGVVMFLYRTFGVL